MSWQVDTPTAKVDHCMRTELLLCALDCTQPTYLRDTRFFAGRKRRYFLYGKIDQLTEGRNARLCLIDEQAAVHIAFDTARPDRGVFAGLEGSALMRPPIATYQSLPLAA